MNTLKYDDMVKKYHYYKNNIIKDYIQQGIYPDKNLIELTLNKIDLALPVLQDYKIAEGSGFNTEKYNDTLKQILIDLTYLYELTYKLTIEKFQNTVSYLDTHLKDLQNKADNCYKRALIEKNSTSLGNTIFYKANVVPEINNNRCVIDFEEELDLYTNSKIACFLNANLIDPDNVIFTFKDLSTSLTFNAPIYNKNQMSFNVPGSLLYTDHDVQFADNETINKQTKIILNDFDYKNKFNVYGGKNKIIVRSVDSNECNVYDIPINSSIHIDKRSYIEFYVLNGNELTFTYNKKPLAANFQTDYNTITVGKQKHFFFECDDDFVFGITLSSGNVYAQKLSTIYKESKYIVVDNANLFKNFYVQEFKAAENTQKFKLSVQINNIIDPQIIIDTILVKELLPLG